MGQTPSFGFGTEGGRPSTTVFDDALAKRPITESGALEDPLPSISGPRSLSRPKYRRGSPPLPMAVWEPLPVLHKLVPISP